MRVADLVEFIAKRFPTKESVIPGWKLYMEECLDFQFSVLLHDDLKNRSHKFLNEIWLFSVFEILVLNFINSLSKMKEDETLKLENCYYNFTVWRACWQGKLFCLTMCRLYFLQWIKVHQYRERDRHHFFLWEFKYTLTLAYNYSAVVN